MFIQRRGTRVVANDELLEDEVVDDEVVDDEVMDDEVMDDEGEVTIDPEATDLLFEAEDVAELLSEYAGQAVDVTVEDDKVVFAVGDVELTAEAEGDEEILEAASSRALRGKRTVSASTKRQTARRMQPSPRKPVTAGRTVRKVPATRRSR